MINFIFHVNEATAMFLIKKKKEENLRGTPILYKL